MFVLVRVYVCVLSFVCARACVRAIVCACDEFSDSFFVEVHG